MGGAPEDFSDGGSDEVIPSYTPKEKKLSFSLNNAPLKFVLVHTENGAKLTEAKAQTLIIRIDGETVASENYSVRIGENGDIIIEFTAEFMQTLEKGEHILCYELAGNDAVLLSGEIALIIG